MTLTQYQNMKGFKIRPQSIKQTANNSINPHSNSSQQQSQAKDEATKGNHLPSNGRVMSKRSKRLMVTKSNNEIEEVVDTSSFVTYKPDKIQTLVEGSSKIDSNSFQGISLNQNNSVLHNYYSNISQPLSANLSIRPTTALRESSIPSINSIRITSGLLKQQRDQQFSRNKILLNKQSSSVITPSGEYGSYIQNNDSRMKNVISITDQQQTMSKSFYVAKN